MYSLRTFAGDGSAIPQPEIGQYADPGGITVGDAVRVDAADTLVLASSAPGASTRALGLVQRVAAGVAYVQYSGELTAYAGLTAGAVYYLSDTGVSGSTIMDTPPVGPSVTRKLGTARNATTLVIAIDDFDD
jgi:hypothetical protein